MSHVVQYFVSDEGFHHFVENTCKANWSIVVRWSSAPFLEDWCDLGFFLYVWYAPTCPSSSYFLKIMLTGVASVSAVSERRMVGILVRALYRRGHRAVTKSPSCCHLITVLERFFCFHNISIFNRGDTEFDRSCVKKVDITL